ncbi:hypothetical protein AAG747_17385 [Rapidithrix thailandica]|uniref:Lipoprotein n=1 Tax=Rapidithrix thailandica TaxID=413964 RepID=A0AAW9S3B1_9BACT
MKKLYVLLCIVLCLYSCKTVPKGNRDKIYYEYNEKGVPQYAVMIYDPKTHYVTYITTHVNGYSIMYMIGVDKLYSRKLLGFSRISRVVRIHGLTLESCHPISEEYDIDYLIKEEENQGEEIYFTGTLPTADECLVPYKVDFFPQKLKRTTGIDYSRFWPPHREVVKALYEGKFDGEAREILIRNVREEGKRQDEKQRRILERLQQEQDSTKKE